MKLYHSFLFLVCTFLMAVGLTSCDIIGDIFEAGMWTALILIIVVALLVFWLIRKFTGGRGPGNGV